MPLTSIDQPWNMFSTKHPTSMNHPESTFHLCLLCSAQNKWPALLVLFWSFAAPRKRASPVAAPVGDPNISVLRNLQSLRTLAPAEWTPWNMKHGNWLRCILQSCEHTHTCKSCKSCNLSVGRGIGLPGVVWEDIILGQQVMSLATCKATPPPPTSQHSVQ